ncbi:MAG: phospho-sugar mutase [Sphaerochaetaceae bacterium]
MKNGFDKEEIIRKASEYIEYETVDAFRNEVATALDENAMDDLYERFYTSLSFGTAGMRGVIGGGTNRINPLMVRKVTQGLSDYLNSRISAASVVIAFDSRNYSGLFAETAALNLCANGVKVYLYDSLRPVPLLSYAVQYLKATAGIVITASHNPSKYNGYKVYWSDGGQVTPPHDVQIAAKVDSVSPSSIAVMSRDRAVADGLLLSVPARVDESYDEIVLASLARKESIGESGISVTYTPLHGSGNIPVRRILEKLKVTCHTVESQIEPDGNFPTVSMPNPEDPDAMRLAIEKAKEVKADIVLGTDPDADRLGIAIPSSADKSEYMLLTGNQIAVLLVDYLLTRNAELSLESKRPLVVKSFVTTDLVRAITEEHNGRCADVLTGFKYIAEKIVEVHNSEEDFYLFGCEESFGYNSLSEIKDKDAVSSAVLAVEMMSFYKEKGITLQNRLEQIYKKYGMYTERVLSFSYEGASGKEKMDQIMAHFRSMKVSHQFAGTTIDSIRDLLDPEQTEFPSSNVIIITFSNGEKMVVRPSGTEPKIKYYFFFTSTSRESAEFETYVNDRLAVYKAAL